MITSPIFSWPMAIFLFVFSYWLASWVLAPLHKKGNTCAIRFYLTDIWLLLGSLSVLNILVVMLASTRNVDGLKIWMTVLLSNVLYTTWWLLGVRAASIAAIACRKKRLIIIGVLFPLTHAISLYLASLPIFHFVMRNIVGVPNFRCPSRPDRSVNGC